MAAGCGYAPSAWRRGGSDGRRPPKGRRRWYILDDDGKIIYGGEAAGYALRFADGRALYFAGDTNVFSDMQLIEQLYHPELAFLPIGDLYTMSPLEAALASC
jgi:L-ascorbate metabolism protein UlaG (beta-lactamase superfamily)